MNWQIAKIEIRSFKAFKNLILEFNDSSLLTLDGPNGFGKTSVFDAIELLLTGKIKRIEALYGTLMKNNRINYEDNLFWNTRSGKNDLTIKIEFSNGSEKLILARHTPVTEFAQKSNNRADQYAHFKLYELPEFSSNDYTAKNEKNEEFIETVFGKNFKENFSYLNYLEQGQNQLLHTRVDKRKEALNNLFNISDVKAEVDKCKQLAQRLTKFISDPARASQLSALQTEAESLKGMIQADAGIVDYKKLSTSKMQPGWDLENPFPTYNVDIHKGYIESLSKLQVLASLKNAIRARNKNEEIESYIDVHKDTIKNLARLGKDVDRLEQLDISKQALNKISVSLAILRRGAATITAEEARDLPGWVQKRLDWFLDQLNIRNSLQTKNNSNSSIAVELARLKNSLISEHAKLHPEDSHCPMCGVDWKDHHNLLTNIELRSRQISESLSADEQLLADLITALTQDLTVIESNLRLQESEIQKNYNSALHNILIREKSRLPAMIHIASRFKKLNVDIDYSFSEKDEIVEDRNQKLITSIRNQKTPETDSLPNDWRSIIIAAYEELEDFYIVDGQALKDKTLFISAKANEAQSSRLKQCTDGSSKILSENKAAENAKQKINQLRSCLEKTERRYSEQTIAEIELVFHIYSGRLIQNYQRGLGLFIESKDGKELKFLTAEKSEYDAIMSMSTGQVSALSLAFFLSLNRVYAKVPLILIDDPSQSLDEVNIASLTDLLRCEFGSRQMILSSHEEEISAYMRYRFTKAGLTTRSLNMQRLARETDLAS